MTYSTPSLPGLRDRIRGLLFGCAVGEAFGHGTFYMTPSEVKRHYPKGLTDFSQFITDTARTIFEPGAWDAETALALCAVKSICATDGKFDIHDMACRIQQWYRDNKMFISPQMRWVLGNPAYPNAPFATALDVWQRMGAEHAAYECLSRVAPVALLGGDVNRNSTDACRLTHPSPRCMGCAEAFGFAVYTILYENRVPTLEETLASVNFAIDDIVPYLRHAANGELEALELHDEDTYWYVRKPSSAAFWAIWNAKSFEEGLTEVVKCGGGAPTNGAITGSLLGLMYGYNVIPERWINALQNPEEVESAAEALADMLEKKAKAESDARD